MNDLWHERFQELKKYEITHGNCNVSKRSGSLGNWVSRQRTNYRLLKEGKSSTMSDDRIRKLESIGFRWISEGALSTEELNDLWRERFQELKKYEKTRGNCNVPQKYGVLGIWVCKQRTNYQLMKKGKSYPQTRIDWFSVDWETVFFDGGAE